MNRPIKYRAWVYDESSDQYSMWYSDEEGVDLSMFFDVMMPLRDKDFLMEYTGIKDKNGKEIYEGDILGLVHITYDEEGEWAWDSVHEVVWGGKDYPAFDLKPSLYCEENALSHLSCSPEAPHYEVIGNIYEDKKLLELNDK